MKLKTELNFTAFHYNVVTIHLSRMTGSGFRCHSARGVSNPLLSNSASLLSSLDFLSLPGTPGCAIKSQSHQSECRASGFPAAWYILSTHFFKKRKGQYYKVSYRFLFCVRLRSFYFSRWSEFTHPFGPKPYLVFQIHTNTISPIIHCVIPSLNITNRMGLTSATSSTAQDNETASFADARSSARCQRHPKTLLQLSYQQWWAVRTQYKV